jgi:hypothetical protein
MEVVGFLIGIVIVGCIVLTIAGWLSGDTGSTTYTETPADRIAQTRADAAGQLEQAQREAKDYEHQQAVAARTRADEALRRAHAQRQSESGWE